MAIKLAMVNDQVRFGFGLTILGVFTIKEWIVGIKRVTRRIRMVDGYFVDV